MGPRVEGFRDEGHYKRLGSSTIKGYAGIA